MNNYKDLIVELTSENFNLKNINNTQKEVLQDIKSILYCIGGPLNDNFYNYSDKQLKTFWEIKKLLDIVI